MSISDNRKPLTMQYSCIITSSMQPSVLVIYCAVIPSWMFLRSILSRFWLTCVCIQYNVTCYIASPHLQVCSVKRGKACLSLFFTNKRLSLKNQIQSSPHCKRPSVHWGRTTIEMVTGYLYQ